MATPAPWFVTTFYRFFPLAPDDLARVQEEITARMQETGILGLVLVAAEGLNGTVAGSEAAVEAFKLFICDFVPDRDVRFKDSRSEAPPFHRVSVDIRREIVGLKRPELVPEVTENSHLTPKEWHDFLASGQPYVMIDTRNRYEVAVGKFRGAIDPDIMKFSEWGDYLEKANLPKDVPALIYCTGGIRCEKAILEMHERGFDKVYQLRDGILGYLAEYPDGFYEGECFVFDDRVAVTADLQPTTRYGTCPGCGLPGDVPQNCGWCGEPFVTCDACAPRQDLACSGECRDRLQRHGPRAAASSSDEA